MIIHFKGAILKKLFYVTMLMIICFSFLAGCASGPTFQKVSLVPDGKSIVYFYRQERFYGSASSPEIYDNGNLILNGLTNGGYWVYYITPGKHVFSTKATFLDTTYVSLESKGLGEEYYIRMDVLAGAFVSDAKLYRVYPEQGKQEITSCKLIE